MIKEFNMLRIKHLEEREAFRKKRDSEMLNKLTKQVKVTDRKLRELIQ